MRIKQFKRGDYIHRFKPMTTGILSGLGDYSYQNEPLKFIGYRNHLIVVRHPEFGIITLEERYNDDGWDYWPESLVGRKYKLFLRLKK